MSVDWARTELILKRSTEHAGQRRSVGHHRAEEQDLVAASDQQRREILDIHRTQNIGLILDIDP